MGTAGSVVVGTASSVVSAARMAAPFFQALLKNLPAIIQAGAGLFALYQKVDTNKQESSKVVQAFELLRQHQDDIDRFLADPERQRVLMEGYSILLRRVQELEHNRRTGAMVWGRGEQWRDEGYGLRQIGYHDRDDGYRSKGDFSNDFRGRDDCGWRNNYRGRDDLRKRDDFRDTDRREYERQRDEPREDLRRRQEQCSKAGGASSKIKAQLVCDVCKERYNSGLRRPTLLPTCGHTFCQACLREVSRREHLRCPVCRSDPFMDVASLPTNRPILDLVVEHEGSDSGEDSEGACGSSDFHSHRNNTPRHGNDNPSCGNDNPSCGNDNPSSGNGSSGWGDDSCSFTMMSYEDQIQLAIIWSKEEMRRTNKNGSTPFAFLDDAEREDEELAQAISLSLMETQNTGQQSESDDGACSRDQCTEMNGDDEEHILLAIQMSLETYNSGGHNGETLRDATQEGEEVHQALRCSMEECQLAHEPQLSFDPRVQEVMQCRGSPLEGHGRWRDREREELEKEREKLKKDRENLEKEKEEWKKNTEKVKNKERARQTLTGLGCLAEDHSKKKSDVSCKEDSDDDCFKSDDCSTDDDNDVCYGKLKDCKMTSCTESEDECREADDLCHASSVELASGNNTAEYKNEDDTLSSSLLWQEEEERRQLRKLKKREWRKKKEEEQMQLAMALSRSLYEAEALQASQ